MFPFLRGKLSSNVMVNDLEIERMLKRNRCVWMCVEKFSKHLREEKRRLRDEQAHQHR